MMNIKAEEGQVDDKEILPVILDDGKTETGDNSSEGKTDNQDEDEDQVIVTIGEEPPPQEDEQHAQAPEWVRELRKNHKELQRKNRELEDKLKATTTVEKPATISKKPTLEDHEYDTDKFEAALANWYEQKRQVDDQNAKADAEAKVLNDAWQAKLTSYGKAKTELKVKDFDDTESTVRDALSTIQQGIILQGSENPALVIYALGKNSKTLKELALITDPVKYAFAIAKLETQLKVTNRKAAPPPEKPVRGTGHVSGTVDSQLERLRAEAANTGDYTKVAQYKKSKRQP